MEFEKKDYEAFVSAFEYEIVEDEIQKLVQFWIHRIDSSEGIPKSIKAFNFGLIETTEDFQVYLTGAKSYDSTDDDWACSEDFIPTEKYLSLGELSKNRSWEQIQVIVKDGVESFIKRRISPLTFVHNAEYLTTGFDNGELIRIEQKVHNNEYRK